jgi:GTPase Era involved in 16S rRNA processing
MIKVAVIGAPNAGKSTLVNKLIGEDVSCWTDVLMTPKRLICHPFQGVHCVTQITHN